MTACNSTAGLERSSWLWDRERLVRWQIDQFNRQLDAIIGNNQFYRQTMERAGLSPQARLRSLDDLSDWPLMSKHDLVESALGRQEHISGHHTYATDQYCRLHRTSGTLGEPLIILDSAADWQWWSGTWQHVLAAAEVTSDDRVFLAFSFGPFIGFWSAHQACADRGAMVIPGGGMSTLARLEFLRQSQATVVLCTPTYALHMADVAEKENFPLASLPVTRLIVAGEAGGSLPVIRDQIQQRWSANIIDHAGATEIGPWGFGWRAQCGLHVIETSFIAEILPIDQLNTENSECGYRRTGELVLTSLGRFGCPVIRYRTGDVVSINTRQEAQPENCQFLWLPDGVIGRVDQMVTVRGVNVFPSSLETIIRGIVSTAEYRVTVSRSGQLDHLRVDVESEQPVAEKLEKTLYVKLGLKIAVASVPVGTLPRSEGKSLRWIDQRFM
jgi:phenylacetate-CoA ligase